MSSFIREIPNIPKGKGLQAHKDLLWFLGYALRSSKKHAAALIVIFAFAPVFSSSTIFLTKGLIDGLTQRDSTLAVWMFAGLAVVTFLRGFSEQLRQYVQDTLRLSLDLKVKEDVMHILHRLDPAVLEHPRFQAYYHAFEEERGNLLSIAQGAYWTIYQGLQLLGTASIFLLMPWWVTLSVMLFVVPVLITQRLEKTWSWQVLDMESREGRRGNYYKDALIGSRWLTSRWVLSLHDLFFPKWFKLIKAAMLRQRKQSLLRFGGQIAVQLMTFIGFFLGTGALAKEAIATGNVGVLVVFFPAYGSFSSMLGSLLFEFSWIQTKLPSVQLIRGLWNFPGRDLGSRGLPRKPLEIVFEDVKFSYPDQEKPVLKGVNLTMREGEYVALVGLNGAGKSTFLKLLAGIYQPTSGRILVNGVPLSDIRSEDWLKSLGYLTQHVPDFDDTIREQIRYGDPKSPWSTRANLALRVSGFDEVLSGLPKGLDTHVGRGYGMPEDAPIELSGGQKQLLMIAQTLYRKARVCIFDEPTSAVDAEKEESFFRQLPEATQGKLCIIVSHRFSVLRRARRVLVMEQGRLIEDGSHDELIEKKGKYAELFTLQAKMYQ